MTVRGSVFSRWFPEPLAICYFELRLSKTLLGSENIGLHSDEKKDLTAVGDRVSCSFSAFFLQSFMFPISERVSG